MSWPAEPAAGWRDHSALILAPLITLPHFSVSSAMSLAKSAGVPAIERPPSCASRAIVLASARPALTSRLSFSTTSVGVLRGTPMPYHELTS